VGVGVWVGGGRGDTEMVNAGVEGVGFGVGGFAEGWRLWGVWMVWGWGGMSEWVGGRVCGGKGVWVGWGGWCVSWSVCVCALVGDGGGGSGVVLVMVVEGVGRVE
jgi:hypothetical protein